MWLFQGVLFILLLSNISNAQNVAEYITNNDWLENILKAFNITLHPDFGLNINQILEKYEYPLVTHLVHTEDDYVLNMHRIPYGRNGTNMRNKNKPAVLLMHGLGGGSIDWVTIGTNNSLPLQLADQGFDVWLGNNRGNTWSRQHVTLDPDIDPEFWDYSYEKCGQYDITAKIDYIIKQTGQQKIFYIGHSQGTSQFFAMASLRPEYNDKIALFSALAPVVYIKDMSSVFLRLADNLERFLENLFKDVYEVNKYSWLTALVGGILCSDGSPVQELCAMIPFFLCGFDSPQVNRTMLGVYRSQGSQGMSKNMILHYAQNMDTGNFQRFDYGPEKNKNLYGTPVPPNFTISAITAPIDLYYSQNDLLVPVKAVERLGKELPNAKLKPIKYKLFNHLDYITAKDINTILYQELIKSIKEVVDNGGTTTPSPSPKDGAASIFTSSVYTLIFIVLTVLYLK